MYNFDKKIDREKSFCRKWDKKLMQEKFGVSKDTIPLDIADMDFEAAPAIKNALIERAKLGDYGYSYTTDDYYKSVINWNKSRHNLNIKKEWIKLMFGTCGALRYICQCFCKPGDNIIINTPVYNPFYEAIQDANCNAIFNTLEIKNDRYYINFEKLENQIKKNNVKLYILCNPHNPGGRVWSSDELHKISDICIKNNVLLVSDEVHREMIFAPSKFTTLWNAHEEICNHSIICCSPNKAFNLGGLKSSYLIAKNESIRNKLLRYIDKVYVTSPHVFIVPATCAAYDKCQQWLDELVDYIEANLEYAYSWFDKYMPKAHVMHAESSYLLWVDFNEVFNSEEEITHFFKSANLTMSIGSGFVKDGYGWVRLNLGTQHDTVKEVFERMRKLL